MKHTYYDFFAGGGMAGFGLDAGWECLFANDIDVKKAESYRANHHGGEQLLLSC
jgi:DNA (cytosine-5)-methyltransferase 1